MISRGVSCLPILVVAGALVGCEEEAAEESAVASATLPVASSPAADPVVEAPPEPIEPEPVPDAVAAQHILIAYRGAKNAPKGVKRSKAEAKELAEKVHQEATSGKDFSALVMEFSEDPGSKGRRGSLGKFKPEGMVKPFSDAAFALKVNQVSEPVETEFGFHIIKRNQ